MKKNIKLFLFPIFLLCGIPFISHAQITMHLRANTSDYLDNYSPSQNQSSVPEMDAIAWTAGGTPFISRSVFSFDLSRIPQHSTIISAYLSLWGDTNTGNKQGDSPLSGSNAWYIQRVSSPWNVNTVNWNTQPSVDTTHEILMPQSVSIYQIYQNINVTALMQDIINSSGNYGLLIRLQTEVEFRSMVFCSSQYPDTSERPLLIIKYQQSNDTCINLRFTQSDYLDNLIPTQNQGTSPEIDAIAWTAGGTPFVSRSVLDFNWDTIPKGATIVSATLSLYGDSATGNLEGDSSLSGPNNWLIQRVTSSWNGNTVTWNTQPTTDTTHQIHMPTTFPIYKDFPSIDVTKLVQDIVTNFPNQYGFMWRLATESYYRSVVFASNYYPNKARRPSLSVCYTTNTAGIQDIMSDRPVVSIYPNPAQNNITITYTTKAPGEVYYTIYNLMGKQVVNNTLLGRGTNIIGSINTDNLAGGMYLIQLIDGDNVTNYKFIKE